MNLRYKEKFNNSIHRQIMRFGSMLLSCSTKSIKQGILKVMFGITYRCQCNCKYCCSGDYLQKVENELSTDQIQQALDQISTLPSIFTVVSFFGGEPFLREDLYYLIRYANKKGLFTEVETNGILLSKENVNRLKRSGLHHIFIRLESSRPETHDKLSNFNGCFEKAIEGIKNCIRKKLACTISTIALKEKIYNNDLERIVNIGRGFGVTSIRILHPTLSGNWLNERSQILNEAEKAKVGELLEPDFVYLESTCSARKEIGRICPSLQKKFLYISPYGEIQPCPFVPISFGNICLEKLDEALGKMWRHSIFKTVDYRGCLMNRPEFRKKYLGLIQNGTEFTINELQKTKVIDGQYSLHYNRRFPQA